MSEMVTQAHWATAPCTALQFKASEHRSDIATLEQRIVDKRNMKDRGHAITAKAIAAENDRHEKEIARLQTREAELVEAATTSIVQDEAELRYHKDALALIEKDREQAIIEMLEAAE